MDPRVNRCTSSVYSEVGEDYGLFNAQMSDVERKRLSSDPAIRISSYSVATQDCVSPASSVTLYAWKKITQYREKRPGSVTGKCVAEVGYLGAGLFGIIETVTRGTFTFLLGNRIVVDCFTSCDRDAYPIGVGLMNTSVDQCVQGTAQCFVSLGTNLISHPTNIQTAKQVKDCIAGGGAKVIETLEGNCGLDDRIRHFS